MAVTNSRVLTLKMLTNIPEHILEASGISDHEECSDDDFLDMHYIIADVCIGERPGDNPCGVIYDAEGIHPIGECHLVNTTPQKWYIRVTEDCCRYNAEWWHPQA